MSGPEAVTEEETLALNMYGAALQIDSDRAAEEFFRMTVDQREFWVRAARRAQIYFENRLGPRPGYIAMEAHEDLMRGRYAELRREIEEQMIHIREMERAIINLVLVMPARGAPPPTVAIPMKGIVT